MMPSDGGREYVGWTTAKNTKVCDCGTEKSKPHSANEMTASAF